ncbi:ABC transporter substrate-binding protein [Chelatococcus sp. SYSU_G07232]|uniref:ABC transporter substrate-binding protein n=1 Tax=Chelatococcus albus TaxID=3047466 RepID=A0ABT7ADD5_9HYPH|nr:ABC transporter substrate-binding protein [Chelatococcus sp. SYSU_G07232]MDJ1156804.1 ABC transporter substrate-binding protein [Chelatococcus sp. SYSU_G07232]
MRGIVGRFVAALAVPVLAAVAQARETTQFPAVAAQDAVLTIHAAADLTAMEPLIRDFQAQHPRVAVTYVEYVTNDLKLAASIACEAGRPLADVILSSAVDHLVRLANDGCALEHRSQDTARTPSWAKWRDEVFGFTFEPAVIVYNYDAVPAEDVPRTRVELAELLRTKEDSYRGRVGTYDPRRSGIGYLLTITDARQTSAYGRLIESFGRARAVVHCCTSDLLDDLASGRLLIGYNLLGSYAYARVRAGAHLRIVLPRDYTVVLSRGAMVPSTAGRPDLGAAFVDYLLSPRGQRTGRERAFFFGFDGGAPPEVDGPLSVVDSGLFRPITIGPALLAVQDEARRARFLADWSRSMIDLSGEQ